MKPLPELSHTVSEVVDHTDGTWLLLHLQESLVLTFQHLGGGCHEVTRRFDIVTRRNRYVSRSLTRTFVTLPKGIPRWIISASVTSLGMFLGPIVTIRPLLAYLLVSHLMWITLLGLIFDGWLCSILSLLASWLLLSCASPLAWGGRVSQGKAQQWCYR